MLSQLQILRKGVRLNVNEPPFPAISPPVPRDLLVLVSFEVDGTTDDITSLLSKVIETVKVALGGR